MEPIEIELKNALNRTNPIPAAELAALNNRIIQTFARKQKGFQNVMLTYLVVMTAALLVLLALFMTLNDLKMCLLVGIVFLVLYEGTVLMKLWYWIMNAKTATLREIKLLQLAVAELKARSASAQSSSTPSFAASDVPALEPAASTPRKKLWRTILIPVWLLAAASWIYLMWLQPEPRDVTTYFEKTVAASDSVSGKEWQESFEVTQTCQHFHPKLVASGRNTRVWISVAEENQKPLFAGQIENGWKMFFDRPAPGRYVVKGRIEQANGGFTLRIGGVDKLPGSVSPTFGRLLLLLFSGAMAAVIPIAWLQGLWLRRIDPGLEK
jgi:hypothetical protein